MRNQQSQLSQQPSPKLLVPTEFQKKRLNQNRQFTELLQRNHNLVQQLDHQSQRSCDMQIEKLRSNASFKSLRLQEQNSPKVNYSPIDVIKLKDILNAPSANRLELFEKKSDRQTSERGISKKTNTLLRDIMTNQQTKPKMPFQKLEKTIFEEEKQFKVPTMGYVNENTSIETPRFFEEK